MKRLWMLFILGLSLLPGAAWAQDVTGGELEAIASSVVLIETLSGGEGIGTGSGTIISADGEIYTNQHVIEGGTDFAIYMLDDIRELPVHRYYATPTYISPELDFAILQIDRNADGGTVTPSKEALPYLPPPATSADASIGERIRIFGYPGIGDGYMVVTSGEVVTVQNGDIGGERLPVWYWTDAEISSGNSGGLVINEAGEFMGLPTWVVSEERTAGRLGGVLPLAAVLMSTATAPSVSLADANSDVPPVEGTLGTLNVTNATTSTICFVYISPSTARDWGEDQLGEAEALSGGAQRSWQKPVGVYDVLLLDCEGETLDDVRNVRIGAVTELIYSESGTEFFVDTPAPSSEGLAEITVRNTSEATVCFVQISPEDAETWGEDKLDGDEVIVPGGKRVWQMPAGIYDVRLLDCDAEPLEEYYGVDVTGVAVVDYP